MKLSLRWVLSIAVLGCAILFFWGPTDARADQNAQSADKDMAPAFALKDLDGRDVRLSDFQGKPILLYFMATWCPQCRAMIPRMLEINSRYSAKGLVILGVNVMESREKMVSYAKKNALPYRTLLDLEGKVAQSYGVVGLPVLALVSKEGRIICWNCRSLDKLVEKQLGI